jgi:5'-3' exonuclease
MIKIMILVDLNQVLLSGLMAQISGQKNIKLEEDLIRHMILNILKNHIKNFKTDYGEIVLCCDNRKYWRKDFFPFYKASRKKNREKSNLDWHMIFDMLAKFKDELKENFPYKVIDVDGAEADDIIGTLVPRHIAHENIVIISSDGDFLQLQRYNTGKYNVKQYNPAQKKFIKSEEPIIELKQKIIQGDKGDGIPNIFSPSDCFVRELRQKPITKGSLSKLLSEDIVNTGNEYVKSGFLRNQTLIDLTFIPQEIKEGIINKYEETKPASRNKLFNYFVEKKLINLMDNIGEF